MTERWTAEQIRLAVEAAGSALRAEIAKRERAEMVKSMTRSDLGWPEDRHFIDDWSHPE